MAEPRALPPGGNVIDATSAFVADGERCDLDAERAVLGAMLLDDGAPATALAMLRGRDFRHPVHATVFEAMARLEPTGAIDVVTLAGALRAMRPSRLDTVGGPQFLAALGDSAVTVAHLEAHCRIVAEHAACRRLMAAAREILAKGRDLALDANALMDAATAALAGAAARTRGDGVVSLEQVVRESFDRIERTLETGAVTRGTPTGLDAIDRLTAGLGDGQLWLIAGRPSMGKTALAEVISLNVARGLGAPREATSPASARRRVLFFSLEMPRAELGDRMLCREAGVDLGRLRAMTLSQDDLTALAAAGERLHALPLDIDDGGGKTLLEVRAIARRWKSEHPDLALIVIDYLQLMRARSGGPEDRERQIGEISEGLKELAKELDVPIVALAQLNRGPEARAGKEKRPQLGDLRGSGSLEQDADVVLFVYRDEVYYPNTEDRGIAEIIAGKQRNGPRNETVRLRWIAALAKFEDLHAPQLPLPAPPPNNFHEGPLDDDADDAGFR